MKEVNDFLEYIEAHSVTVDNYIQIVQDYLDVMADIDCESSLLVEYKRNHNVLQMLLNNILEEKSKAMKIVYENELNKKTAMQLNQNEKENDD